MNEEVLEAFLKFSGQDALRKIEIELLKQENPNYTLEDIAGLNPSQEEVDRLYNEYLRIKQEYY